MWSRKHVRHVLHWSNSCLEKLVIDFRHVLQKNQEFKNQNVDLVRLANYFCVSLILFDCHTRSNSINGLSSILFDWPRRDWWIQNLRRIVVCQRNRRIHSESGFLKQSAAHDLTELTKFHKFSSRSIRNMQTFVYNTILTWLRDLKEKDKRNRIEDDTLF